MKHFLLFVSIFLCAVVYGQTNSKDSAIKVTYADMPNSEQKPAVFINGKFAGNALSSIKPDDIESITVLKQDFQFESNTYKGQILITTKQDYAPKLISLTAIKEKYTNLGNKPVLFSIDGNIINGDYNGYYVDENNILQIIIDKVLVSKENLDLGHIKLLTKTDENIKKLKEIRIRGNELPAYQ